MSHPLLRVGIVGVGIMGTDHAERLAHRTAGVTLAGVTDPDGERAAALADRLGTVVHDDPLALVTSPDVDAVVLASPGFVHEEQVVACLDHEKPVLCEKPLTMDDASSLRLVEAEAALGRRLVTVGFMRRFDPEYAAVKAAWPPARTGSCSSSTTSTATGRPRTPASARR